MDLSGIILGPIVTEKAERQKTADKRVYTLRVSPRATKIDIKAALKRLYDVDASTVRIMRTTGKTRLFGRGRTMRKRAPYKKAMVTLTGSSKALDLTAFKV